jgi:UDP-N-acetylmuramate--L-alanine ligase
MPTERGMMRLIGVGGSGMLPLALLLKEAGYEVQGIDSNLASKNHDLLCDKGIQIINQEASLNLEGIQQIVASPAVPSHHPVLRAARRIGVDVKTRSKALTELIQNRQIICVAGSHGKSTTTAMLMHIMAAAGLPFGYMLGASYSGMPPAYLGAVNSPFILEACEAHGALLDWQPTHAIVTNIDDEHATHYGDEQGLSTEFLNFMNRVKHDGILVICGDDAGAQKLLEKLQTRPTCVSYGFASYNQLQIQVQQPDKALLFKEGHCVGTLSLLVQGEHNVLNATAAFAMATALGVTPTTALAALSTFTGVDRRLQQIGPSTGPFIFDDFAHHPNEIAASLKTVRNLYAGRVIAVLQPQLHSRVRTMAPAFANALALADRCLVLPVDGLGEPMGPDDTNSMLAQACADAQVTIEHVSNLKDVIVALKSDLHLNDCIVVMAGRSGDEIAQEIVSAGLNSAGCSSTGLNSAGLKPATKNAIGISVLYGRQRTFVPSLMQSINTRAHKNPSALAVQMGSRSLTYGDLMTKSADLASLLKSKGVIAQQTVAVCLGRSIDRVVAFVAILRLGAVYLPLDPIQPMARIELMLLDSGAKMVVVNSASPALPNIDVAFVNCGMINARAHTLEDFKLVAFDEPTIWAEKLAYLIYTSGTTGRPKGVEVCHASLANYATAAVDQFGIQPHSRVSLISSFGFDVSVGDMAMALNAGACLVLPTDIQATPGAPLARFIEKTQLTHLSITPALLSVLPDQDFPDIKTIIVAGESCHQALVDRWAIGRKFINAYGPTEATVEATFFACRPGQPVAIGRPIDNMGACIVDDNLCPVAPEQHGELCLFGVGLARGYLHQPELTHERFITVTLPGQVKQRVYRTGDRAFLDASGNLHCLGRQDDQFKFHGYRIEPSEIESVLCQFHHIKDAIVSKMNTPSGEKLVAHIVMAPDSPTLEHTELKAYLTAHLPAYMHPSVVLPINDMPRTSNGKRDRSALPLPPSLLSDRVARKPKTPTEAKLLAWVQSFAGGTEVQSVRDSLTEAGFDSLGLASLLVSIEALFGVTLDLLIEPGSDTIEMLGVAVDLQVANASTNSIANSPLKPNQNLSCQLTTLLRPYLATWPGTRLGKLGLIRCLMPEGPARLNVYWCFQSGEEMQALTHALDALAHNVAEGGVRLFGMRSGHLAFDYDSETIQTLASLYADEIESIATTEPLVLGGNCQGGMIAGEVARELQRRGRSVCLTILMEQGYFKPLSGNVLLLFGARSYLNPYGLMEAPEKLFKQAYPDGFYVEMLPGGHGEYFRPENIAVLAEVIGLQATKAFASAQVDNDIALIKSSMLFNADHYRRLTGLTRLSTDDLIKTYFNDWSVNKIEPSTCFDSQHYETIYQQGQTNVPPLLHFLKEGIYQGFNPWSEQTVIAWQKPFINHAEFALAELNSNNSKNSKAANWPKLQLGDEVHIHTHSQSHIVFHEFQNMLVSAFKRLNINAKASDETIQGKPQLRVIIAPHDFFYREPKVDVTLLSLPDTILFNTEQVTSVWFSHCFQYLRQALGVIDINLQTAVCLSQLGISTRFLPLGRVDGHPIFEDNIPIPADIINDLSGFNLSNQSASTSNRPIDLIWIGSNSKRRQAFLDVAQPTFDEFKSFIRLVNVRGALSSTHNGAVSALSYAALGQRAKILLNIHHFGIPYFEWQRLMHFGFMQGACVVTETASAVPHLIPGEHYLQTDLQHIPELVKWLLQDEEGCQTLELVRAKGYEAAVRNFNLSLTLEKLFL